MITYYVITNGLDSLRAIVGPLPSFLCEIVVFFKNFIHCNVAQFTLAITVTKYAFVRIEKKSAKSTQMSVKITDTIVV